MLIVFALQFVVMIWALCAYIRAITRMGRNTGKKTLVEQEFVKPFSVPEYLDRMEQESIKLADRREQHLIVLWWGFDGIRLNEDGTAEWISKKPKESQSLEQVVQNMISFQDQELQIQRLERRLQALQIQNTINSIASPYPKHPTQCCITQYVSGPHLSCGFYLS